MALYVKKDRAGYLNLRAITTFVNDGPMEIEKAIELPEGGIARVLSEEDIRKHLGIYHEGNWILVEYGGGIYFAFAGYLEETSMGIIPPVHRSKLGPNVNKYNKEHERIISSGCRYAHIQIGTPDEYEDTLHTIYLLESNQDLRITIVRWRANPTLDPVETAENWYQANKNLIHNLSPYWDRVWFEGVNEPPKDKIDWLNAFESERIRKANSIGYKVSTYCWSVGGPSSDVYQASMGVLQWAQDTGHALSVHEYFGTQWDNWMYDGGGYLVGRINSNIQEPWWTAKFINVFVSETGADSVGVSGDASGWRYIMDADTYIWNLKKLDEYYNTIPNVLGIAGFLHGQQTPPDWDAFEWGEVPHNNKFVTSESIVDRVYDYISSVNQ